MKRWHSLLPVFGVIILLLAPLAPFGSAAARGAGDHGSVPTQQLAAGFPVQHQIQELPTHSTNWFAFRQRQAGLSGQFTPASTLDGRVADNSITADLEPGFPLRTLHTPGTVHIGPAIHTLVGNIDDEPTLEIVVTALASGPLYAWNSDGSLVSGWPVYGGAGVAYPGMGELSDAFGSLEVFSGYMNAMSSKLVAYSGLGTVLPGWPRDCVVEAINPPALADVDGDGQDEIFIGEGYDGLYAYHADGTLLPGWPVDGPGGPDRSTPAIVDLDGDGDLEILTSSSGTVGSIYLFAYHHNGTPVSGFPVYFPQGLGDMYPAVGDVDGDGELEIVVVAQEPQDPWDCYVAVLNTHGQYERTMTVVGGHPASRAAALADLDRDCVPEIVVQAPRALNAWRGDGSALPGWPAQWSGTWENSSAPVVGDVDGDAWPEILVTTHLADSDMGEVRVYDRYGVLLPGFPFQLVLGGGAVPSIADIDLDGHNEFMVTSRYWPGYSGYYDKVWAYDLGGPPHGRVEWGQFGGGPRHQGYYIPNVAPVTDLDADNDSPTMLGHTTILTATAQGGCVAAYTWAFGDGSSGTGDVLTHTYAALGTYTAVVTASKSSGFLTATTVVTILEEPVSGLQAASDSPTVLGQATTLTATLTAGTNLTCTWDLGDGSPPSPAPCPLPLAPSSILHTYAALGTYTAAVTASNSVSLLTATTVVTVIDEPVSGLSVVSDGPTVLGYPTTLTATVTAGANLACTWLLGDGSPPFPAPCPLPLVPSSVTHTYPTAGAFTAVVTASNFGSSSTATTTVLVDEVISGLHAVNSSPTPLGRSTLLAATIVSGTNVLYRWDLGDGTTGFWRLVSHVYPALGTYTAVVTASNSLSLLTDTTVVLITDVPISGLAASNDGPTTLGDPTTLTATIAAGTNVTYTWTLGDGSLVLGPSAVTHTYAVAGAYTAVVTASNSTSVRTATTLVTVVRPLFHIYLPLVWRGRP